MSNQNEKIIRRESQISRGTYGIVYKVSRKVSGVKRFSALKRNIKDDCYDFAFSIKELDLLVKTIKHPYIILLKSVVRKEDMIGFSPIKDKNCVDDTIHFRFDMANCDLYDLIVKHREEFNERSYLPLMLELFSQILLGVKYLHDNMIIHRDLKPNNILIFNDKDGNPYKAKISDFGMSKKYTYQEIGSPNIMSYLYRPPEILLKRSYDMKSDIWCLGCIFYEMIFQKSMINLDTRFCVKDLNNLTGKEKTKIMNYILLKNSKPISEKTREYLESERNNVDPEEKVTEFLFNLKSALKPRSSFYNRFLDYYQRKPHYLEELRGKGFSLFDIFNLMENMLTINPYERVNINSCIRHEVFSPLQEKIDEVIDEYPKSFSDYIKSPLTIYNCFERKLMVKTILNCVNNKNEKTFKIWYSDRIIFHALNLADKYIYKLRIKQIDNGILEEGVNLFQTPDINGPILFENLEGKSIFPLSESFEEEVDLMINREIIFIYVCLYMSVKYFFSGKITARISFEKFINIEHLCTKENIKLAEDLENMILEENSYQYYYLTIFEEADYFGVELEEDDIEELFRLYIKLSGPRMISTTHYKMFEYFHQVIYPMTKEERKIHRDSKEYNILYDQYLQ